MARASVRIALFTRTPLKFLKALFSTRNCDLVRPLTLVTVVPALPEGTTPCGRPLVSVFQTLSMTEPPSR